MTTYFDCSDAEGLDLGEDPDRCLVCGDAECRHNPADECQVCLLIDCECDAADGGEENDDMQHETPDPFGGFLHALDEYEPLALVSMRNAIDANLKARREKLRAELNATEHALNGTKPRARRSDAGRPRQKPANEVLRDEKGVAV